MHAEPGPDDAGCKMQRRMIVCLPLIAAKKKMHGIHSLWSIRRRAIPPSLSNEVNVLVLSLSRNRLGGPRDLVISASLAAEAGESSSQSGSGWGGGSKEASEERGGGQVPKRLSSPTSLAMAAALTGPSVRTAQKEVLRWWGKSAAGGDGRRLRRLRRCVCLGEAAISRESRPECTRCSNGGRGPYSLP